MLRQARKERALVELFEREKITRRITTRLCTMAQVCDAILTYMDTGRGRTHFQLQRTIREPL